MNWELRKIRTFEEIMQEISLAPVSRVFMVFGADGEHKNAVAREVYDWQEQAIYASVGEVCEGTFRWGLDCGAAVVVLSGAASVRAETRREWMEYLRLYQAKTLIGVYAKAALKLKGQAMDGKALQVAELTEHPPAAEGFDFFLVVEPGEG